MKAFASVFVWPDKHVYKEAAVRGYYINIGQIFEQYEIGTQTETPALEFDVNLLPQKFIVKWLQ